MDLVSFASTKQNCIAMSQHLKERSTEWLQRSGFFQTGRLSTRLGDGYLGWPSAARFAGIIVTCSPSHVPQPLKEQLAVGGRLIIPVGPDLALSRLLVITRASQSVWEEEFMFTCRWVPLQGACVRERCDPVAADAMPVCPGIRHARENNELPVWHGSGFHSQ